MAGVFSETKSALLEEAGKWDGVRAQIVPGGKHMAIEVSTERGRRRLAFSAHNRDRRSLLNNIMTLRKLIREILP